MAVIANFWVWLSPIGEIAVAGVAQVSLPSVSGEPEPLPDYVPSVSVTGVNAFGPQTLKMLRNFPERYLDTFPTGLWNCYVTADGYHELTGMRELLQDTAAAHPDHFRVAGCWDYATGEPVGGVGSPWFVTPLELADIMPGVPQPGPGGDPETQPPVDLVFGVLQDIVLGAGQAKRKFV